MRVLITGATGFIGRALVPRLLRDGHAVVVWARSASRARARLGAETEVVGIGEGLESLTRTLDSCDAVVNLTGEPLLGGRWTPARRQALRESRVGATSQLVRAIAAAHSRPRVLVSGSAVGFYGNRGDELLNEGSSPDQSFLSTLCQDWEAAAVGAEALGLRVVRLRTGVVLGRDGGALASMLPLFRLGTGGPIGNGKQYLPWIHLHDLVQIVVDALADNRFAGPINGVAPDPVTSRTFARTLGDAIGRPAVLPTPALALHVIFGQAASVLLDSQCADPAALRQLGFRFAFPTLKAALADIAGGTAVSIGTVSAPIDAHASDTGRRYLDERPPTFELRTAVRLKVPLDEAFSFFSKAENLGLLTPSAMHFAIRGRAPAIGEGTTIEYGLRVGPVPIAWRSRIVNWQPGVRFIDIQEQGPYRSWWHEHSFRAEGASTVMEDRVCYAPPFGLLGRLANRLFIVPTLQGIFQYRADVIRLRFGAF